MKVFSAVLLAVVSPCFVKADTVLLGTLGDPEYSISFQQHQYLAQQFTFSTDVTLSSTKMTFVDNSGSAFNGVFQVVDSLGPGSTAANVLFTTGITLPAGLNPTTVTLPTPLTLDAGNYYLLLSTTDLLPLQTRWQLGASILPGGFGTVGDGSFSVSQNVALPVASPFVPLDTSGFPSPAYLTFQIEGSPVPEPSSLLLLGIGAISLLGYRKARSHG
jgi:hypothetical protein